MSKNAILTAGIAMLANWNICTGVLTTTAEGISFKTPAERCNYTKITNSILNIKFFGQNFLYSAYTSIPKKQTNMLWWLFIFIIYKYNINIHCAVIVGKILKNRIVGYIEI